ncbi:MAG: hypothetical protein IJV40_10960 [Oscillospiraceae bacterium]|nr:hypothetical protein [Oscillospiraceae bacterium]
MATPLQNILDKYGIMVIDGSMSTALENMGLDLNHRLWTARALAEAREKYLAMNRPASIPRKQA